MADEHKQSQVNFGLDPNLHPILHVDSYLIGSNEHVVTLNFAQALPDPTQQNIVSRVSLTRVQAKEFLKTLNEHIEKFEL